MGMSRLPLADARLRELQRETRPALALRSDEGRSLLVESVPGARLHFAWGVLKGAPSEGWVRFEVRIGSRIVYSARAAASARGGNWIAAAIPLPALGAVRLDFRGRYLDAAGRAQTPLSGPSTPFVGLAEPRLYMSEVRRQRRTLLWISLDAVRADHLGIYEYSRATSPEIDRRAKDWVVFDNAVATAPWTLPSMASQFSSRHPSAHGAVLPTLKLDGRYPTLFSVLAREGFTVLGVSANSFVSKQFGLAEGFDAMWRTEGNADQVNRLALRALEDWGGGDLALFVHYMDPHAAYTPPSPYDRLFDPGDTGGVSGQGFQDLGPQVPAKHRRRIEALYDGEIAFADNRIGALLDLLRTRGVLDDAVIVLSSDHGEEFLDHGGWKHGRTVYGELLHVPLALRVPGIRPARVASVVSLIDVAPTILDAFGIERPASFQGRSLLPLLRGASLEERPAFAETEYRTGQLIRLAARDRHLVYISAAPREHGTAPPTLLAEELYDLETDPRQGTPLPTSPHLARMRRQALLYLAMVRSEQPDPADSEMTPELERELRALGYIQ